MGEKTKKNWYGDLGLKRCSTVALMVSGEKKK